MPVAAVDQGPGAVVAHRKAREDQTRLGRSRGRSVARRSEVAPRAGAGAKPFKQTGHQERGQSLSART